MGAPPTANDRLFPDETTSAVRSMNQKRPKERRIDREAALAFIRDSPHGRSVQKWNRMGPVGDTMTRCW